MLRSWLRGSPPVQCPEFTEVFVIVLVNYLLLNCPNIIPCLFWEFPTFRVRCSKQQMFHSLQLFSWITPQRPLAVGQYIYKQLKYIHTPGFQTALLFYTNSSLCDRFSEKCSACLQSLTHGAIPWKHPMQFTGWVIAAPRRVFSFGFVAKSEWLVELCRAEIHPPLPPR